jgi:hypothetical protein
MKTIADALTEMAKCLSPVDRGGAAYLREAISKTPQQIADDLNIWGGAGSFMDQSHTPDTLGLRVPFEEAAISLAGALVAAGARGGRMEWWANRTSAPSRMAP